MSAELNPTEIVLKAVQDVKAIAEKAAKAEDIEGVKTQVKADIKVVADELDKIKGDLKDVQEKASQINLKAESKSVSFGDAFAKAVADNFDQIKSIGQGSKQAAKIDLKAVQDMTLAGNAGGVGFINQQRELVMLPSPKVNVRDLVSTISSDTGLYRLWREGAGEGTPAFVGAGSQKPQIDSDYTTEDYSARFLAAFVKVDRSMLQDLSFLQSALPQQLLRRFYIAENASFNTTMAAAAAASLSTTGTNQAEQIIDYIAGLEANRYTANGIVLNPLDWAKILRTKPSDYSVPGGFQISPTGQMLIAGVPVFKADWVTANNVYVADWTQINRLETTGLNVQFFEQDEDNVQYNAVTVRIECREVLVFQDKAGIAYEPIASTSVA